MVVYVTSSYVMGCEHMILGVTKTLGEALSVIEEKHPRAVLSGDIITEIDELGRYVDGDTVILIHISSLEQ